MKIAMITWNFNKLGGIERCVYELANELSKKHELHIFSSSEKLDKVSGICFHKIPIINKYFVLKTISFFIMSYFVFNKANKKEKFDIIHLHNPSLIHPNIYTLHSVHKIGLLYQERQFSLLKKYVTRLRTIQILIIYLANYNLKQKNVHLVAISEKVRQEVKRIIDESKVISVIYHGVNVNDFKTNINSIELKNIKERLKIKYNDKIIMFVANEFKRKGLDILLESLSKLEYHNWHLIIIGESNDGLLNTKQAVVLAKQFGILEKCSFLGKKNDLQIYYSISDLFVMPTLYEPLGMVYMEALSAGVATIVTDIAGASEFIQDNVDGIILRTPISVSLLTSKIEEILKNENIRLMLSSNGKNKMKNYTWEKVAINYENIYITLT